MSCRGTRGACATALISAISTITTQPLGAVEGEGWCSLLFWVCKRQSLSTWTTIAAVGPYYTCTLPLILSHARTATCILIFTLCSSLQILHAVNVSDDLQCSLSSKSLPSQHMHLFGPFNHFRSIEPATSSVLSAIMMHGPAVLCFRGQQTPSHPTPGANHPQTVVVPPGGWRLRHLHHKP